jgi:DNA-binding transcriptional regulator YdaS (Cro superfamily)
MDPAEVPGGQQVVAVYLGLKPSRVNAWIAVTAI